MSDRPAIAVEGLRKAFGRVQALDGVSFAAQPGTVLGLLGPNGAGKTTAVRILTTLLPPDGGRGEVAGLDVVRDAEELRKAIGLAGQFAAIDENLTGRENLDMVGRLYHLGRGESARRATDLLERFDLVDAADRTAKTYSGGMRKRLDLAASLVGHPHVLFLDEPTTGLDPRSRISLWDVIHGLVREGTTLLLTTQYLDEADHLCDRIVVIDLGRVIAEGTSDELKKRVGGEFIEVHVVDRSTTAAAAAALGGLGTDGGQLDEEAGTVVVPVTGDHSRVLLEAVRRLDNARVEVADLALRRPTLDDVFLALTGHLTEEAERAALERAGRRARRRRKEVGA